MARLVQVLTAGCPLCEEALKNVRDAVAPCGCSVGEQNVADAMAHGHALTAVPTIVAEGQVVFVGKPTLEQTIALLRR